MSASIQALYRFQISMKWKFTLSMHVIHAYWSYCKEFVNAYVSGLVRHGDWNLKKKKKKNQPFIYDPPILTFNL